MICDMNMYEYEIILYSQILKVNPQVYKHKQSEIVPGNDCTYILIFLADNVKNMPNGKW